MIRRRGPAGCCLVLALSACTLDHAGEGEWELFETGDAREERSSPGPPGGSDAAPPRVDSSADGRDARAASPESGPMAAMDRKVGRPLPTNTPDVLPPPPEDASIPDSSLPFDATTDDAQPNPGNIPDVAGDPETSAAVALAGRVVDIDLQPVPGVAVLLEGRRVTTDGAGAFALGASSSTYDIAVVAADSSAVWVFQGVSRSDPTLQLFGYVGSRSSTTASGSITGGAGSPNPSGYWAQVLMGADTGSAAAFLQEGKGSFSLDPMEWFGSSSTSAALLGLQWRADSQGNPIDSFAFGSRVVTLRDGVTFTGDVALQAVAKGRVAGTVTAPAGYQVVGKIIDVNLAKRTTFYPTQELSSTTAFTYPVPVLPGASLTVSAFADSGQSRSFGVHPGISVGATNVVVSVDRAPELLQPPAAQWNVSESTGFSYRPVNGSVHVVAFESNSRRGPNYYVLSASGTVRIPDPTGTGVSLPRSTSYQWSVHAFGPSEVNGACGPGGFLDAYNYLTYLQPTLTREASVSASESRAFTTTP